MANTVRDILSRIFEGSWLKKWKGDHMGTVYKYCDSRGLDIIQNLELKITPANQFNDPFEFTPYVICSDVGREAREIMGLAEATMKNQESSFDKAYQDDKASGKFNGSFQEYLNQIVIQHVIPTIPNTVKDTQKNYPELINQHVGILCLSKKRNSIVMFAHYGDEHHGVAIGFDSSFNIFQQGPGLRSVNYVSERVLLDISQETNEAQDRKHVESLIHSKNKEWHYEDEVRQMFPLDVCPIKKPIKDKRTGKEIIGYFIPIRPEVIVSVSLGVKCPPELEKQIVSALQKKHFEHVKLDRARLHKNKFELIFE